MHESLGTDIWKHRKVINTAQCVQGYFERAAMQIITTKYSYEGIKNDLSSLNASRIWSLITVQCIFGAMEKYVLSLIMSCKDKTHLLT